MPSISGDFGANRMQYPAQPTGATAATNASQAGAASKTQATANTEAAGTRDVGPTSGARLRAQVRDFSSSIRTAQTGAILTQTAAGALDATGSTLQQMRDVAVQAAAPTATPQTRSAAQSSFGQLTDQIDRIGASYQATTRSNPGPAAAQVSTALLLAGNGGSALSAQGLGLASRGARGLDLTSPAGAQQAVATVDQAMGYVSDAGKGLTALQNRFVSTLAGAASGLEALSGSAGNGITNAAVAQETAAATRDQLVRQPKPALQAQGNVASESALPLLN